MKLLSIYITGTILHTCNLGCFINILDYSKQYQKKGRRVASVLADKTRFYC